METNFLMPLSVADWIVAGVLLFAFLVQVVYYLTIMNRVGRYKPVVQGHAAPPVSVIVCAKNESENLVRYLPLLMDQDYPSYEVIVVNDSSSDDSEMVLAHLKTQYPNLYYTTIPLDRRFHHSKKLAVTIGVKAAKNEHLLFTDADCFPTSKTWVNDMMAGFAPEGKSLVVGYSPYEKAKGFLNRFIRYDAFWNGVQYLGFAIKGKAYMAVGRNMAYTKTLFSSVGGFNSHIYIESGDDDLFVQQAANRKNTNVVITPSSLVYTKAQTSFSGWIAQKARHLTTAPLYKFSHRFVLGLEPFTRQTFWLLTFYALILQKFWAVALGLWLVRTLVQFFVLKRAAKRLNENKIYWALFLFDFTLPFVLGYLHIGNLFRTKQIKWK